MEALEKISKILPRLESGNDNEIVNSIYAIRRILKSNNSTFHDLSNQLLKSKELRFTKPKYTYKEPVNTEQTDKADFINNSDVHMTEWEKTFWADIQDRIYNYDLTEKQMNIVNRIYKKAKDGT